MQRPEAKNAAASGTPNGFQQGIVFALMAQAMWGLLPVYLKLLSPTPPINIVAHRVIWAYVLLLLLTFIGSSLKWNAWPQWSELVKHFRNTKMLWQLAVAAVLVGLNWVGFVLAVSLNRTMDVSVGYYICPQVVVLLGVLFQKERLSRMQWLAFAITSVGVLVMAISKAGFPWFGLLVALSFGFYALMKKRIACPAMTSLTFETGILLLPALATLLFHDSWSSTGMAGDPDSRWVSPMGMQWLLVGTGIATVVPLACYVTAVKRLPLSLVGVLQFLGPTIQFGLSVLVFGEALDWPRLIGIILIWAGVVFFLLNARRASHRVE